MVSSGMRAQPLAGKTSCPLCKQLRKELFKSHESPPPFLPLEIKKAHTDPEFEPMESTGMRAQPLAGKESWPLCQ